MGGTLCGGPLAAHWQVSNFGMPAPAGVHSRTIDHNYVCQHVHEAGQAQAGVLEYTRSALLKSIQVTTVHNNIIILLCTGALALAGTREASVVMTM